MPQVQALSDTLVPGRKWEEGLETLQEQVNQGCRVNGNQTVDWPEVARLAEELLQQGVPHFQIAAYWGVAQLHQQGFPALIKAAERMLTLVAQSWQQAFPPLNRLRGRLAAIEWWVEQSLLWIQQSCQQPIEVAFRDQTIQAVTALDQELARQCDSAPPLFSLLQGLQRLAVSFPPLESEAVAAIEHPDQPLSEGIEATPSDLSSKLPAAIGWESCAELARQASAPEETLAEILAQAQREVAAGRYQYALNRLQHCQQRLFGRERLKVTCYVVDCLRQAGCMELASLQVEQALSLVKQYQLENWEPPLAQQVLESAFDLFMDLGKNGEAAGLLTRLCLLDVGRAFYKASSSKIKEKNYGE